MPTHSSQHLDDAYDVKTPEQTRQLYDDWAETYEQDLLDNGYVAPERAAAALTALAEDKGRPLLDLGCGTGLSGQAFSQAGFRLVDGTDFSDRMMAFARAKGVYRQLIEGSLETPLPGQPGDYAFIAAVGVLTPGHAPAVTIQMVMAHLEPGGLFVFSLNDHALKDPSYRAAVDAVVADGLGHVVFEEYGPHAPGMDIQSFVFVLRRI